MKTSTVDSLPFTMGDRLRKSREHAGLEQKELAKIFGVTSGTISNWERGRGYPRGDQADICEKWAQLTGVSAQWLMFGYALEGGTVHPFKIRAGVDPALLIKQLVA